MEWNKMLFAQRAKPNFDSVKRIVDHYKITRDWTSDLQLLEFKYGVEGIIPM